MSIRRRRLWVEQARGRADVDAEVSGSERRSGGSHHRELARRAWRVAHEMARALNVSPWEALLGEVRRTAGEVAWLDRKVAQAPSDAALLSRRPPDPEAETEEGRLGGWRDWVDLRNQQRQHLARVSKMAIDAGVARQLVEQFALQGETIARMLTSITERLGLTDTQEALADSLLREVLLTLDDEGPGGELDAPRTLEGEVVDREEDDER